MKHNVYFDGKVQSLGLTTDEGPATVGVMAAGKYTFSTSQEEHMIITSGVMKAKLPGQHEWKEYRKNQDFFVPAKSSFDVEVAGEVSYICFYK